MINLSQVGSWNHFHQEDQSKYQRSVSYAGRPDKVNKIIIMSGPTMGDTGVRGGKAMMMCRVKRCHVGSDELVVLRWTPCFVLCSGAERDGECQ